MFMDEVEVREKILSANCTALQIHEYHEIPLEVADMVQMSHLYMLQTHFYTQHVDFLLGDHH